MGLQRDSTHGRVSRRRKAIGVLPEMVKSEISLVSHPFRVLTRSGSFDSPRSLRIDGAQKSAVRAKMLQYRQLVRSAPLGAVCWMRSRIFPRYMVL